MIDLADPLQAIAATLAPGVAASLLMAGLMRARGSVGGRLGLARHRHRGFFDAFRNDAASAPEPGFAAFVAVCEFDRFESIRRNVGYSTAHAIIEHAVAEIRRVLPTVEIGRTHRTSIEFAASASVRDDIATVLAAIVSAFDEPIPVEGCAFNLSPRIGFALASALTSQDELIERVELALHDRENAHENIVDATPGLHDAAATRFGLLRDLHHAIDADALDLHYQPKLRCRTETIDSVEALLRWTHPQLGAIRTDDFISMAEETGLIRRLTEWTLRRAIRDQALLIAAGHRLTIYINISGLLLPDRDFADTALTLVAGATGEIGFEITETAVIDHPEQAITNLKAFTAAGIKIAIDDYGSGLSSLAYLKQLPAHELKIDKLFISGLTSSHRDPLLVRSSIDLAHALEMEVTAEGVDNPMALSLLRVMGCDLIQGFLVAKPLALPALIAFLDADEHVARIAQPALPRFGIPRYRAEKP
jgi:EAL domain-containing protein (putative c-di-GMP-specific phosphodiesterase class I)/GGDEF domain-containing protein